MSRRTSLAVGLLACALGPGSVAAQGVDQLTVACTQASGLAPTCVEAAVTARAVLGHVGLLAGQGSEVPGSAGTLGRRLGRTPRVSISARAGFTHVGVPDLADPGEEPSREATFVLPSMHAGLAIGVFDGFSPLPTVGGLLAVDVIGSAGVVFLPKGQGFDGPSESLAFGVRVGLLRESFTLPGAAISVMRRSLGEVSLGSLMAGDAATVRLAPSVTSVRATVGKDLLSIGLLAGVGWDRYGGEANVRVGADRTAGVSSFPARRRLYFGGASMNFLVLQLSAEIGWAEGFDAVTGYQGAPFDATAGTAFGSLAFRLTI